MSLLVGELHSKLSIDKAGFKSDLDQSEGMLRGFGGKMTGVLAGLGLGAAVGKGIKESLTAFGDLERGMNEVFTLMPGMTDQAMGEMTDQVRDFAKEMGVLPDDVVPALYQSISAGVPPDSVFDFLETANMAAIGGVTDLSTAVDGISSVVNAYGSDVVGAAQASDLMFTAVKLGKTNFEELSSSLFQVIPTASALGVEFGDVTGALAQMTAQGTPTRVATTQMRQLLVELSKAGGKASGAFEELAGQSFQEFIAEGGNVADAIDIMNQAADNNGVALQDMFGSVEAGQAALALGASGTEAYRENLAAMSESAGASTEAFGQMDQGMSRSFDKIKAAAAVLAGQVGEKLAPILAKVAEWAIENFPKMGEVLGNVFGAIGDAVEFLKGIFGGFGESTGELKGFIEETWEKISSIVEDYIEYIRTVIETVTGIITAIWEEHGEKIMAHVKTIWESMQTIIGGALDIIQGIIRTMTALFKGDWEGVWNGIKQILRGAWEAIRGIFRAGWSWIKTVGQIALDGIALVWEKTWEGIKGALSGVWEGIKAIVKGGVNALIGWIEGMINRLVGGINKASEFLNKIPGVNIGKINEVSLPRMHSGGIVPGPRGAEIPILAQAGERVIPLGGGGGSQRIVVELDGQTLMEALVDPLIDEVRVATGERF